MPKTPATDPTDPDFVADPEPVLRLIRHGAEPHQGHLRVMRTGQERWLAVTLDEHGLPQWVPTLTKGAGVSEQDFDRLARGRSDDGILHVDGKRYVLVPPKPSSISQLASLMLKR